MEQVATQFNYRKIPLDELLNQLSREGFAVTPELYQRFLLIAHHFFPDGLPVIYDDDGQVSILEADKECLKRLLGPVAIRNEAEQQQFSRLFDDVLTHYLFSLAPPKPPKLETIIKPPIPPIWVTWFSKMNWLALLLVVGLILAGFGLYVRFSDRYVVRQPEIRYEDVGVDKGQKLFFVDSLTAAREDSVWWEFEGVPGRQLALSRDTLLHSFSNEADYTVKVYRQTYFHPFIAWIRGMENQVDTATTDVRVRIDYCATEIDIKSVKIIEKVVQVVYQNRSPGIKAKMRYQWVFGDGTQLVSADSLVAHTYASIDPKMRLTLKPYGQVCLPGQFLPFPEVSGGSFDYLPMARSGFDPQEPLFQLVPWVPYALFVLIGLLFAALVWWLLQRLQWAVPVVITGQDPPYFLHLPDQKRSVWVSQSLINWADQLRKRESVQYHQILVRSSIRTTIRQAGLPVVVVKPIEQSPRYLVLIDEQSSYDQQSQLYALLIATLAVSDIMVDTFFFQSDPRTCWNQFYPKGINLETLVKQYNQYKLLLLTEGNRLLDHTTGEVAQWAQTFFENWESRAILTPVYVENWNYIESVLLRFFIVLPATPDGQLKLRQFLQLDRRPKKIVGVQRDFLLHPDPLPNRGIFDKSAGKITIDEIDQFLHHTFAVESRDSSREMYLHWWAYATGVYPKPDWAITITIGKAIEEKVRKDRSTFRLVTTTNLIKIAALPWLREKSIPARLQGDLLQELRKVPGLEQLARHAVLDLLNQVNPTGKSLANREKNLRTWEQQAHSSDPSIREQALEKLEPFQKGNLITDDSVNLDVAKRKRQRRRKRRVYDLAISALPVLIASFLTTLYSRPDPVTDKVVNASLLPYMYNMVGVQSDSAGYYNNLAVDSSVPYQALDSTYAIMLGNLYASLRHRITFPAFYNLHVLRYNLGVHDRDSTTGIREEQFILNPTRRLDPTHSIDSVLAPITLLDSNWVPKFDGIRAYLTRLVREDFGADSMYVFLTKLQAIEYNDQQRSGRATLKPASNNLLFQSAFERAKSAFNPLKVVLLLTNPRIKRDSVRQLSFLYPSLAIHLSRPQIDSLLTLETERMILYRGGTRAPNPDTFRQLTIHNYQENDKQDNPPPSRQNNSSSDETKSFPEVEVSFLKNRSIQQDTTWKKVISIPVKPVKLQETTSKSRGIPQEYGLLIGELQGIYNGDNGWIYLALRVPGAGVYRVALAVGKEGGMDQINNGGGNPIVCLLDNIKTLPDSLYSELRERELKFYSLETQKRPQTDALNYIPFQNILRAAGKNTRNSTPEALYKTLTNRFGDLDKKSVQRVYVWGARRVIGKGYEMQDVHMNQGSVGKYGVENAPYQDGAVIFDSGSSGNALGVFIYFDNQSFTVDSAGDPVTSRHGAVNQGVLSIKQAKDHLMRLKFYNGQVDDLDDSAFTEAVRKFQAVSKLTADGILGVQTATMLKRSATSTK